jgi:hypothetical protein
VWVFSDSNYATIALTAAFLHGGQRMDIPLLRKEDMLPMVKKTAIALVCTFGSLTSYFAEATPQPFKSLIYMADGKAANGIPVLKLCPEVKARKVSGQDQFSFMITQGDFLVGGVREGLVDIEPGKAQVLPSLSGENKKGFGLITIEGQGRCVVGIVTGKRSAILGEKVSIKGTKLVNLYEGDSWFAVALNLNLSAKGFVLEEEKIKKNDELRNLHLQKKSLSKKKRIALMNSGNRRTWIIKGAGDRPQLVQTQACPRGTQPVS